MYEKNTPFPNTDRHPQQQLNNNNHHHHLHHHHLLLPHSLHNLQLHEFLHNIFIRIRHPILVEPLHPAVLRLCLLQVVLGEHDHVDRVHGVRLRQLGWKKKRTR